MKRIIETTGKTGAFIIATLTLVTLVISCWQFYKSSVRYNLAGAWKLKFVNESSSYKAYVGEVHTQKVFFSQNESGITGNGEKWEYNGKLLPFDQHRKIEYSGALEDDYLKATFKLYGLLRESSGSVELQIIEDGKKLVGRFVGTAGDTKGTVTGERIE